MKRIFDGFPQATSVVCPICGTNRNEKCALIQISGTSNDGIVEGAPTHVDCLLEQCRLIKPQFGLTVSDEEKVGLIGVQLHPNYVEFLKKQEVAPSQE